MADQPPDGVVDLGPVALGESDHQEAGLARHRVPSPRLVDLAVRSHVGREVVGPERLQGPLDMRRAQNPAQADLERPVLAEDLVDLAAVIRADGLRMCGIGALDEVAVRIVPELIDEVLRPAVRQQPALRGKRFVAQLAGHRLARGQGRDVERAQPGNLAEPLGIERVVLRSFEQAVAVGVVADQILERCLDPGPEPLQECRVGRHLVLAIGSQDVSRLAVHRGPDRLLGPVTDDAGLRVEADARRIIDLLAEDPLQLREKPGDRMGVMPDVCARARRNNRHLPSRRIGRS